MESFPPVVWSLETAVAAFVQHGFNDGDLISHDWLAWALNLPENASRETQFIIMDRVEQFKNALLTVHRIYIVSARGEGYRIVPPSDQSFVAASQAMKEVKRQFKKCAKVLEHTRMDALTTDQARRHLDTQTKVAALASMVGRERRDVFRLHDQRKADAHSVLDVLEKMSDSMRG